MISNPCSARSRQYRQLPAVCERLQGRIWQAQGRFEDAQPCFERSLATLLAIDDVVEYARSEEAYGLFYIARDKDGDMELGQALLKSAQETFRRLGVSG
jgi:tetratricopeptide (TPR) repeat protein